MENRVNVGLAFSDPPEYRTGLMDRVNGQGY